MEERMVLRNVMDCRGNVLNLENFFFMQYAFYLHETNFGCIILI